MRNRPSTTLLCEKPSCYCTTLSSCPKENSKKTYAPDPKPLPTKKKPKKK